MRPSDWFLVELAGDPTPGDAFGVRELARTYSQLASSAADASDGVRAARSSGAAAAWIGDAGEVFRERSHRMPGELQAAHDSYAIVADALTRWAMAVDDTQSQADRGLQLAREAHADLTSAHSALSAARSSWSTVTAQQLTYQRLQRDYASVPPPPNVAMPTDIQLRSAARAAQQAHSSIEDASARITDADARLTAARRLVAEAKERRDEAEVATIRLIVQAQDSAIRPSSIWESIQSSAGWQTFVTIATVALTIVSIVALFVAGPLVWAIILAATAILLVNALLSIAQGKDAWGELALLAIGLIPGGRLIGTAVRGLSESGRLASAASHISELAAGLRAGATSSVQNVTRRLADETGELRLPRKVYSIPWDRVKFSQRSVTYHKVDRVTRERYTMGDIIHGMKTVGWKGAPIDVVHLGEHGLVSVDNTRLLSAQKADIPVRAFVHHPDEPLTLDQADRFKTEAMPHPSTWGDAVYGRIADQREGWGVRNPHGSFESPTINWRMR